MTRLAVALAVLAAMPSAADAARSEFFGVAQGQLDVRDLNGMAAKGVRTDRFDLGWRSVERTQGSFNWTSTDRYMGALAAHGVRAAPFIWGSPPWIASNPTQPPIDSAAHVQAWQNFLKAAARRYGPGGTYWGAPYHQQHGAGAAPVPVYSWQIWNEPNLQKFFDPGGTDAQTVQKYAQLLRISHDAIKSISPGAKIVLAGEPGHPSGGALKAWEFLDRLYGIPGAKADFDVAALHPYGSTSMTSANRSNGCAR